MTETFAHLFRPLALRHRRLKNRITVGAHTGNMSEDGLPGARRISATIWRGPAAAARSRSRSTPPRC